MGNASTSAAVSSVPLKAGASSAMGRCDECGQKTALSTPDKSLLPRGTKGADKLCPSCIQKRVIFLRVNRHPLGFARANWFDILRLVIKGQ